MGVSSFQTPRSVGQAAVLHDLNREIGPLTAEKLYRYFLDSGLSAESIQQLRQQFQADNHLLWYVDGGSEGQEDGEAEDGSTGDGGGDNTKDPDAETMDSSSKAPGRNDSRSDGNPSSSSDDLQTDESNGNDEQPEDPKDSDSGENRDQPADDSSENGNDEHRSEPDSREHTVGFSENGESAGSDSLQDKDRLRTVSPQSMRDWEAIEEKIRRDMQRIAENYGRQAGTAVQALVPGAEEGGSYEDFLSRFAVRGEVMRGNDEEFDYIFFPYNS